MSKNTIADLDVTTANNTDVLGQNSQGSADANQLDAVDRATLALLARFYSDLGGLPTVGGSANAITLTSASTYQSLESGLVIAFKAGSANTAAATLNLDGLGAKAIRRSGDVALAGGEIKANGRYLAMYDAAYNSSAGAWVLMNPEDLPLTGGTLTGALVAAAGTTAVTPVTLQSGTLNTTAAAGGMEYDGKAFYATTVASSRQAVAAHQFVIATADVSLSNSSTSAQNVFDSANDTLTLAASTTYFFEAQITLTTGTTTHSTAFGLGGTATFTSIRYNAITSATAGGTSFNTNGYFGSFATASATTLNSTTTQPLLTMKLSGVLRVNGGGTIIPQITFSAGPGSTCQTEENSYFRCWPVGSDTVAAVGNWA